LVAVTAIAVNGASREAVMLASVRVVVLALVAVACGPTSISNSPGDGGADTCAPGATRACYSGAPGTAGVGLCAGGTQRCDARGTWGACENEVTPKGEICGNGIDENCNGTPDENNDADGDGFTTCGGDCCDATTDGCGDPRLVNPGAFEAPANMVDDDCDGVTDNAAAATCDSGLASNSATALDYAKAIELCQSATMTDTKWGVISARFTLPSGAGTPNANQRSIRPGFGGTTVRAGSSFAVLSTGNAAAPGQSNPGYVAFQGGNALNVSSAMPADWLTANNNQLPNAPGCPAPNGGTTARDPIMLELKIRTPTNAKSFKLSTAFFSSEFPEWVCSPFNDFFVVLLDSGWTGQPANPADKNLAFYKSPANQTYPVGVNLAHGNTGLFQVCTNGNTGCATDSGAVPGTINTCMGTTELASTGMDVANPAPQFPEDPGYCGANNLSGGGTGWLVTSGNVNGGELITLRIALWDTSDGYYDSLSIIDNFQWSVEASMPGTVIF
jgi:hypothetical protein